jgi:hypothetical protein
MESVLKQKNIVKLVLNDLSKHGTIPGDGFLCGGAVANILINMTWGVDTPINDLDIFVETKTNKDANTPLRTDKLIMRGGYFHLNHSYNHGNNYKIVSSDRDGMINIVKVWRENRDSSKNYMYILKGFDLNCTQVGIDLKTGELIYTPEFEDFLKDKQLKVVAPYTPGHTAIRLFKKLDELDCYCDIEGQMKLLSQPFNNEMMIKNSRTYTGVFGMYFSIKYKEMYDKYADKLKPYFKLSTLFEHKRWIWERRWELSNQITKRDIDRDHVLSWLDPDRNPPQGALENWAKFNGKIWGLIPVKYMLPDGEFVKIVDEAFSPLTLMSVWNMLYGGLKKTMVKKVKTIFKYQHLKDLCMVNDDFYDCDFSDKTAKELNQAIENNVKLGMIIHKYNLNLQESIELNSDINKVLRKEGKWFSDLIYRVILENGNGLIQPNMTNILNLFEKEKVKLSKPFMKAIDLSGLELPEGVEIKELVSDYDLAYAGRTLKNCINNEGQDYKRKLRHGKTKIFVITTNGSMSALELNKMNDFEWKERWTLSYCNKVCNEYHKHISQMIQAYFHKELILSSIADKIEKWDYRMETAKKLLNPKQDKSTANNRVSHGDLDGIGMFGVEDETVEGEWDELFDMGEEVVTEDPFDDGVESLGNPFDDDMPEPRNVRIDPRNARVIPIRYDGDMGLPF